MGVTDTITKPETVYFCYFADESGYLTKEEHIVSESVINWAKDFVRQVGVCGVLLKKAILFGSYAKNKHTSYSDMDIALVSDQFKSIPSEDVKLFLKALRKYYMVQPQTYNTRDLSPSRDPVVAEILRTGIEIT